jgi:phosphatidylglycerol:prolipoprotein diacylglycerol transferase
MIPYYQTPSFELGPFHLEVFGVFVALGVWLAAEVLARQARREGLDSKPVQDFAIWGLIGGVVMGHWVHLFGYHHEEIKSVWSIFTVWSGLSSFGGLLGGVLAAMIFFRVKKVPFSKYADAFALGVAPGWGVARIGCFAVHDHPGVPSHLFFAVNFPASWGGPRLDLGLIDAIWLFSIAGLLFALRRRVLMKGLLLPLLAVLYAIGRFTFDFFRAYDLAYIDKRYFGLTPAQYGCMMLVVYAVWQFARAGRASARVESEPKATGARA